MIEKIIIISLFTIGYCCTFWPGMIFEKIGNWLELNFPEWINKPTWQCYICTCFWLGTVLYWLVFPHCTKYIEWNADVFEWGLSVGAAMGLNAIISEFTNKPEEVEIKSVDPEIKINIEPHYKMQNWEPPTKEVLNYGICPECKGRCYPIEPGDGHIYCNKCGAKY